MTERVLPEETLGQIDDQLWKRLGVSQTFDRLLVQAVAREPGTAPEVQARIGSSLGAGAARFLALTFDKLVKDLSRRRVLELTDEGIALDAGFHDRLVTMLAAEERGDSRVDPTPGVTLADVQKLVQERERKAKPAAVRAPSRKSPPSRGGVTPRTRKSSGGGGGSGGGASTPTARRAPPPPPPPQQAKPAKELFTSRTVNSLLDTLDGASLFKDQLARKIKLGALDLDRFLTVAGRLELTRLTRDEMVELHWKGREVARTTNADRRMVLIDLVKQLRVAAETDE